MMTRLASPFAPPPPRKVKIRSHKDPVSPILRAHVLERDGGCVGRTISACQGSVEIDHVRVSGGLGLRSPSVAGNLVTLCRHHHRLKTEYGRIWRPLLLDYLARVEVGET